ncbi:MAG: PEP-utilizing enzyme [Candidatus Paceibacterota bacterium]
MTSKQKRKLELFGHRDFTLALYEIGLDTETGPLPYLDNIILKKPYFVAERKAGKGSLYIDSQQVEWQKGEILKKIKADNSYVQNMLAENEKAYAKVGAIFDKGEPVSKDYFEKFISDAKYSWAWYAGLWWTVEMFEQKNLHPDLLDKLMEFRKRTDKFAPALDHIVRSTILSLYPNLGKYADMVTLHEIINGNIPDEEELKIRYKEFYFADGHLYTGKSIKEILENTGIELVTPKLDDHLGADNLVKGQIAYKGIYRGKVSIVFTKEEAKKFEEGNVLLSSSTTPDLMIAIRKAGAIVTDEGGIISHAAIMSREFKIPCVIGTKIATQVFKDGDMVEVDAERGVVKKLK